MTAPSGLIIVDKPAGWTSHDVVARVRRLAGTRRVGHAGTLDPMATGVLVLGVEKATRLLGYLALSDKEYQATIRLGQVTDTLDAEGTITATTPAAHLQVAAVRAAAAALTGEIQQVPPAVSAIKVAGRRSYQLARAGKPPELAPRPVTVHSFEILAARCEGELLDVDVVVRCSSGTYIRALARDLGDSLGVGGHLTALRRTRTGPYGLARAHGLDALAALPVLPVLPMEAAAAAAFPVRKLTDGEARTLSHGGRVPGTGESDDGPVAAFAPDGRLIALAKGEGGQLKPIAVFA